MPTVVDALAIFALSTAMQINTASERTLFDFESSTGAVRWQITNDDVMGGVSTSRFQVENNRAVFSGTLSLENNGGFASVRTPFERFDSAGMEAFLVRVKGDGRRYKLTVRTQPGFNNADYQLEFETKRHEWQDIELPLTDFVPTWRGRTLSGVPPIEPASSMSIGFLISDNQPGPFRLEIRSIRIR